MEVVFFRSETGRSPVREAIERLAKADQARFVEVSDGIERYGLECPRVRFRQLEGKLWEIKFATATGGYRIAYVVVERERMVWLHVFRKESRRTTRSDLAVARKRMKEVMGE
jgi:phage-related protein